MFFFSFRKEFHYQQTFENWVNMRLLMDYCEERCLELEYLHTACLELIKVNEKMQSALEKMNTTNLMENDHYSRASTSSQRDRQYKTVFKCNSCDFSTIYRSSLERHTNTSHELDHPGLKFPDDDAQNGSEESRN